jgi:hypothetical protein
MVNRHHDGRFQRPAHQAPERLLWRHVAAPLSRQNILPPGFDDQGTIRIAPERFHLTLESVAIPTHRGDTIL